MPLLEIANAAVAHRTDVVALSFSTSFPVRKIAAPQGVLVIASLDEAAAAVGRWRGAGA